MQRTTCGNPNPKSKVSAHLWRGERLGLIKSQVQPLLRAPTPSKYHFLKVALVHYHLRTGGVTKVVSNQSEALTQLGVEHLVLSAGPEPENIPHAHVPQLDYLSAPSDTSPQLHPLLLAKFIDHFGCAPDLWHIHNPTLGKSALFPQLIQDIAESQTPLILQPHDFAEDNRPSNYPRLLGDKLYPLAPQIHYAFINSRDKGLLQNAGLPSPQSHLLPNAVALPSATSSTPPTPAPTAEREKRLVLYPVRGIRRKNLGEFVLLAALAPPQTRFAVSLAPENEQWQAQHDRWRDFAREKQLPIQFDVTNQVDPSPRSGNDYLSWITQATHLATTSIAEGFGLAFLEPILHCRPLLGRDLPEITTDFRKQGIPLTNLYQKIPIPATALNLDKLRQTLREQLTESYRQYGATITEKDVERAWQQLFSDGEIDFGSLPEPFQEKVIQDALSAKADYLQPLRDWLKEALAVSEPALKPEALSSYSIAQSQHDLASLYQVAHSATAKAPTWLPKEKVLAQYLSPERFHFLIPMN